MKATGERFIPGEASWLTSADHLARYAACIELCSGKTILDAACGSGYGTQMLASCALSAQGIDIDPEAIAWATERYGSPTTNYRVASIAELPFEDASFDVVVSFETLEHVSEELQTRFIDEARRVLRHDGVFVISTPDRLHTEARGTDNPFHVHELSEGEFRELLGRKFTHLTLFHQNMWAYNEILPDDVSQSASLALDGLTSPRGQNLIAVCGAEGRLPNIAYVRRTETGLWDLQSQQLGQLDAAYRQVSETAARYENTWSWRITAPLRAVRRRLK